MNSGKITVLASVDDKMKCILLSEIGIGNHAKNEKIVESGYYLKRNGCFFFFATINAAINLAVIEWLSNSEDYIFNRRERIMQMCWIGK